MSLVRRDVQSGVDKMAQLMKETSASISSATQGMLEEMKVLERTNTAR